MSDRRVWLLMCLMAIPGNCEEPVMNQAGAKDSWYTRYPHYPGYCSTPNQMNKRSIPPLEPIVNKKTKLLHVTAITRHGARTIAEGPSKNNYNCWKGFWTNNETGVWDCALKSMLMPPSAERVMEEEQTTEQTETDLEVPKSLFFFTASYDALKKPLSNTLNGTCQVGQLLLQGYEQQVKNGEILREAYLWESQTDSSDSSLHLFEVGGLQSQEPWSDDRQLYLRSDDSQATLVSGELILRGLFEKELILWRESKMKTLDINARAFPTTIAVHTTDHSRDILGGFREGCEALARLQSASDISWEYQDFVASKDAKEVVEFLESSLSNEPGILDCLMATVCTDRPLPDPIGIYDPHPNSWFNRIASYFARNHSFHLTYNDGEFSKLSMGPLWAEILDHILPVINSEGNDQLRPAAKLALYSGYDSTIMEILASLGAWDGFDWPPYGSMVVLEIHEILDSSSNVGRESEFSTQHAFRLLYNGEVITYRMKGCIRKYELCDSRHLLARVQRFAKRNVDCTDVNLEKPNAVHIATELMTDSAGIVLVLLIVAASSLIGSMAVFYYLTGALPTEEIKSNIQERVFRRKTHLEGTLADDVFSDEPLHA